MATLDRSVGPVFPPVQVVVPVGFDEIVHVGVPVGPAPLVSGR